MDKVKQYGFWIVLSVAIAALITAGICGYMWGRTVGENRDLKKEKKAYERIKHEQDSIIREWQERIVIVVDSMNNLAKDGVAINRSTDKSREFIRNSQKKENEEINNIPNLSVGDQLKLFSRNSDEYKSP